MSQNKKQYYATHEGSVLNRKWITNGIEEKLVNLDKYQIESGWYIGRSIKAKKHLNQLRKRKDKTQ